MNSTNEFPSDELRRALLDNAQRTNHPFEDNESKARVCVNELRPGCLALSVYTRRIVNARMAAAFWSIVGPKVGPFFGFPPVPAPGEPAYLRELFVDTPVFTKKGLVQWLYMARVNEGYLHCLHVHNPKIVPDNHAAHEPADAGLRATLDQCNALAQFKSLKVTGATNFGWEEANFYFRALLGRRIYVEELVLPMLVEGAPNEINDGTKTITEFALQNMCTSDMDLGVRIRGVKLKLSVAASEEHFFLWMDELLGLNSLAELHIETTESADALGRMFEALGRSFNFSLWKLTVEPPVEDGCWNRFLDSLDRNRKLQFSQISMPRFRIQVARTRARSQLVLERQVQLLDLSLGDDVDLSSYGVRQNIQSVTGSSVAEFVSSAARIQRWNEYNEEMTLDLSYRCRHRPSHYETGANPYFSLVSQNPGIFVQIAAASNKIGGKNKQIDE